MKIYKAFSFRQWLKNTLIFIPAIFAISEWDMTLVVDLFTGFLGFSLIASAVYLNNDLKDLLSDQQHPEKKKRALASRSISTQQARIIIVFSLITGGIFLGTTGIYALLAGLAYLLINILYTFLLKKIPLLDLISIISGYYIRLIIGQEIANATLSNWIITMVSLIALYLAIVKRYGDVKLYKKTGIMHRRTVKFYAQIPIKLISWILAIFILVFYTLYLHFVFTGYLEKGNHLHFITILPVGLALTRYHLIALKEAQRDPISILIKDIPTLVLVCLSFGLLILTLYGIL